MGKGKPREVRGAVYFLRTPFAHPILSEVGGRGWAELRPHRLNSPITGPTTKFSAPPEEAKLAPDACLGLDRYGRQI